MTEHVGDEGRHERGFTRREARQVRRVEVEHRAKDVARLHGDDELGARGVVTRDVSGKRMYVVDELHLPRARGSATDTAGEVDAKTPHAPLVGADREHRLPDASIEAAPVGLRERLPKEARERRFERDGVGLAGDGGANLRQRLLEP